MAWYFPKKVTVVSVSSVGILFLLDTVFQGATSDVIFAATLAVSALFLVSRKRAVEALFLIIILFWIFLPRIVWRNDLPVLSPDVFYKIGVLLTFFLAGLASLSNMKLRAHADKFSDQYALLILLIFFAVSIARFLTGSHSFENRVDTSFINLVGFVPNALMPFVLSHYIVFGRARRSLKSIVFIGVCLIAATTGSKFLVFQSAILPPLLLYLSTVKIGVLKTALISIAMPILLLLSVLIGNAIRYGRDIQSDLLSFFASVPFLVELVVGRLNFLSIMNSSVPNWGQHAEEVFSPLVFGILPRAIVPERLDINNGMWFGQLIGLVGTGDNTYVAPSVFNDLLIGTSVFWACFALFCTFILLGLIKRVFFRCFNSNAFFLVLLCSHFIIPLESNFAFLIISLLKIAILVVIFLGVPTLLLSGKTIRFFTRFRDGASNNVQKKNLHYYYQL